MKIAVEAKRLIQKILAYCKPVIVWVLMLLAELLLSAIPAALIAAELLPLAYAERGRMAFGGEWLAIILVFCTMFYAIRTEIYNRTKKEENAR